MWCLLFGSVVLSTIVMCVDCTMCNKPTTLERVLYLVNCYLGWSKLCPNDIELSFNFLCLLYLWSWKRFAALCFASFVFFLAAEDFCAIRNCPKICWHEVACCSTVACNVLSCLIDLHVAALVIFVNTHCCCFVNVGELAVIEYIILYNILYWIIYCVGLLVKHYVKW